VFFISFKGNSITFGEVNMKNQLGIISLQLLLGGFLHTQAQTPDIDSLKRIAAEGFYANLENYSFPTSAYGSLRSVGRRQFRRADSLAFFNFEPPVNLWVGARNADGSVSVTCGDGAFPSRSRPEFQPTTPAYREPMKRG
jgi:hypothetical protein